MTIGSIDYASSYFKYKTPTPIRGEPTNKALKTLQKELQANASSVETDLGGGNHGYLGLVLTDAEYATIPNTQPFIPPTYPPPLVIPANSTPIQALELKEQYNEQKRLYLECKNVEKALLRHIQEAIEDKYINSLVDEYTNLLTQDVPTIMQYLFYNYGKVRSEEVSSKEAEVMSMTWQPSDPIVLLTRPIENLQKLAQQAGIPYTDQQLLEKGLSIIRSTRDFEYALTEWEKKPVADRTWATFKTHFHEAQLNLKKIRGPTMQQAGFHHANLVVNQIKDEITSHLQTRDSEFLAMLQTIPSLVSTDSSSSEEEHSYHQRQQANAASDQTQVQILKLLKDLTAELKSVKSSLQQQPKFGRKTPDNKTSPRKVTDKYCWTHGGCNHDGTACNFRAQGHKEKATFTNRMGGSNAYCT